MTEGKLVLLDQASELGELLAANHVLGDDAEVLAVLEPALPARLHLRSLGQQPSDDDLAVQARAWCKCAQ